MSTSNYCDLYCKACGSELFLNKDKHAESTLEWAIDNFKRNHAVTCGKSTVKMGLKPETNKTTENGQNSEIRKV